MKSSQDAGSTPAGSTRNCNFQRQVPGNCSDKEPYFLPDYQGNTAFVLFYRDRRDRQMFSKNRHFLSEISVTHATGCCDNSASKWRCIPKNRKLPYHLRERPKTVMTSCLEPGDIQFLFRENRDFLILDLNFTKTQIIL